jgi:molybdate transport system substrate-binding protein
MRRASAILVALFAASLSGAAWAQEVTVAAAASLAAALTETAEAYAAQGGGVVRSSFAASSALAKQIEGGGPAHIFVSADSEWMDYLAARRLVAADSRVNLFGNSLVVVAPLDTPLAPFAVERVALAELVGDGRIATGDPDHVPVGKYARQALERLGQWRDVDRRLARAENVRAALALVERGEAPLGIVYATDAAASKKVKVLSAIPGNLHQPIVYPAAIVTGRETPQAKAFLSFLSGGDAKAIFARHGFKVN